MDAKNEKELKKEQKAAEKQAEIEKTTEADFAEKKSKGSSG